MAEAAGAYLLLEESPPRGSSGGATQEGDTGNNDPQGRQGRTVVGEPIAATDPCQVTSR